MWRKGGGKAGYEELRQPEIAEDPLLRLFARCDEIEDSKGKGVVDTAGRKIVCDAEETACLRQRGVSATWWARHFACLLHACHHFTTAAAKDGSLKINEDDGRRRVAYEVWEGVQPIDKHKSAALEEAGILETDHDTHRRVGDGISGRALPPSWEVINSELYAIYAYL